MLGAIIGDTIGSIYEFDNRKRKDIPLYHPLMRPTDDSVLTIAVMETILEHYPLNYDDLTSFKLSLIENIKKWCTRYPDGGYGGMFYRWLKGVNNYQPYNSYGNGAGMRISPISYVANSIDEVKKLSKAVTEITHNHIEGIKGAEAIAISIYLARGGKTKQYIHNYIKDNYYPNIDELKYEDLVRYYSFDETCQGSVPQAIYCFLISVSYEDCIRICISIGGDTDTICAMSGAIAEAYYKEIPSSIKNNILPLVGEDMKKVINKYYDLISRG